MSSKLSFTDINAWYTSLNTLRNKKNISLGSVSAPNLNERQVRATDINDYINKLNALRTNEYFRHADWISISTVSSNEQIRDILKENINGEITNLNKVCADYSVTTSDSTCKTRDQSCSTCDYCGQCQTNSASCITNSTYTCITDCSRSGNMFSTSVKEFSTNNSGNSTNNAGFSCNTFTFNTCSTFSTSHRNYNFSVVSGKAIISNSKTTPT